jgi:hypothetical protein
MKFGRAGRVRVTTQRVRADTCAECYNGMVTRERLLALLGKTHVSESVRRRIQSDIASDFHSR